MAKGKWRRRIRRFFDRILRREPQRLEESSSPDDAPRAPQQHFSSPFEPPPPRPLPPIPPDPAAYVFGTSAPQRPLPGSSRRQSRTFFARREDDVPPMPSLKAMGKLPAREVPPGQSHGTAGQSGSSPASSPRTQPSAGTGSLPHNPSGAASSQFYTPSGLSQPSTSSMPTAVTGRQFGYGASSEAGPSTAPPRHAPQESAGEFHRESKEKK